MAGRLFIRRRDGRIEVRLNEYARSIVRDAVTNVLRAERDPAHEWHVSLSGPIDPSRDEDNPISMLTRQNETSTNAELAGLTVDEEFLTNAEAWAWLATLQVALRSTATAKGLLSEEQLDACDEELLNHVRTLQHFLFELAACL